MSFECYMQKQIEEIESSGLDPETWVALHAEAFRAAHEVTE